MADESEKWLERRKLNRQSIKEKWPYSDAGSPVRSRLRSERLEPKTSGKLTVDSVTVQELAGQLAQFRKELAAKDREITRLKTERARLEASGSISDGASHSQLQSHQFKELHRLLKEKDDKITKLTARLKQFERAATALTKIVRHFKDQSRVVMELKEQLERSETERSLLQSQRGQQEVTEVPSAAAPSEIESLQKTKLGLELSLVATKSENQTLVSRNMQIDMQLRQLKATNAQLLAQVTSLREQQQEAAMAAKVVRERDHLQQRALHMQASLQNLEQDLRQSKQQITHSGETLREQGREIQRLTAENLELRNELVIERVKATMQPEAELASHKVQSFKRLAADQVGSGSYGSVHVIEVNGIPCIAKRLHNILLGRGGMEDVGDQQRQPLLEKFQRECFLLSRLRHPNIVQFMGVHYGKKSSDLTLIMEYLHMDLEKCVESYPNLPLPLKISILLDVSYGLLHLHSQTPPIIHRDLSAANVLLTAGMRAKIADLGVSKYLDTQKQTAAPGAYAYMPPEALKKEADYSTKLDNFSFGVVALYVTIQEFPEVDETMVSMSYEAFQKHEIQIQKRIIWIQKVRDHCLRPLVLQCLQDLPKRRPTTPSVNDDLKQLSVRYPRRFKDILEMQQYLERLERKPTKGV